MISYIKNLHKRIKDWGQTDVNINFQYGSIQTNHYTIQVFIWVIVLIFTLLFIFT